MAAAAEPQAVPVISTDATAALVSVLDGVLAAFEVIRPSFSVLPDVADYPVVDLAVRLWASVHPEVKLVEWGHWTSPPSGDNPGYWIEGYKLEVGYRDLCTVHTPDGLRTRQPTAPVVAASPAELTPSNVIQLPVAPAADESRPEARCSCGWSGPADRADGHDCSLTDDTAARFSLLELD